MENLKPTFMTVKEIAQPGILPETALRRMLKAGQLPAVYSGRKALINYSTLCNYLNSLPISIER